MSPNFKGAFSSEFSRLSLGPWLLLGLFFSSGSHTLSDTHSVLCVYGVLHVSVVLRTHVSLIKPSCIRVLV